MTETVDKLSSESKHWTDVPVGNENAERHAYKLPLRKKYYLCIVHTYEDTGISIDICRNIERQFQLKCMISCRSFFRISEIQVRYMMMKSVGIVFLLSPAFFKDKFCVSEMELAVEISYDGFFSAGIINVLLQDIDELPLLLKPYICIEAQKTCDIAAKINDTFCQTGIKLNLIDKL